MAGWAACALAYGAQGGSPRPGTRGGSWLSSSSRPRLENDALRGLGGQLRGAMMGLSTEVASHPWLVIAPGTKHHGAPHCRLVREHLSAALSAAAPTASAATVEGCFALPQGTPPLPDLTEALLVCQGGLLMYLLCTMLPGQVHPSTDRDGSQLACSPRGVRPPSSLACRGPLSPACGLRRSP